MRVVAPATLLPPGIEHFGVEVMRDMREGLAGADIVMMLRLQLERMHGSFVPSVREYFHFYGLDYAKLAVDKYGKSACIGKCTGFWPPLIASGKPVATAGAKASLLGTTKRADGRLQVAYNHHPLYTFVKDASKGQTNGEGVAAFGAKWYALSSAGAKVGKGNAGSNTAADHITVVRDALRLSPSHRACREP